MMRILPLIKVTVWSAILAFYGTVAIANPNEDQSISIIRQYRDLSPAEMNRRCAARVKSSGMELCTQAHQAVREFARRYLNRRDAENEHIAAAERAGTTCPRDERINQCLENLSRYMSRAAEAHRNLSVMLEEGQKLLRDFEINLQAIDKDHGKEAARAAAPAPPSPPITQSGDTSDTPAGMPTPWSGAVSQQRKYHDAQASNFTAHMSQVRTQATGLGAPPAPGGEQRSGISGSTDRRDGTPAAPTSVEGNRQADSGSRSSSDGLLNDRTVAHALTAGRMAQEVIRSSVQNKNNSPATPPAANVAPVKNLTEKTNPSADDSAAPTANTEKGVLIAASKNEAANVSTSDFDASDNLYKESGSNGIGGNGNGMGGIGGSVSSKSAGKTAGSDSPLGRAQSAAASILSEDEEGAAKQKSGGRSYASEENTVNLAGGGVPAGKFGDQPQPSKNGKGQGPDEFALKANELDKSFDDFMKKMDDIERKMDKSPDGAPKEKVAVIDTAALLKEDGLISAFLSSPTIQGARARTMAAERDLFTRVRVIYMRSQQKGLLMTTRPRDWNPQAIIRNR